MDKNTITGLILVVLILIGYNYYVSSQAPEKNQIEKSETNIKKDKDIVSLSKSLSQNNNNIKSDTLQYFQSNNDVKKDNILKNKNIEVSISSEGASIEKAVLLDYKSYYDYNKGINNPLVLFDAKTANLNYLLNTPLGVENTKNYIFNIVSKNDSNIVYSLPTVKGDTLFVEYTLLNNSYMVNVNIYTIGKTLEKTPLKIIWNDKVRKLEKGFYFENMYSTLTYKEFDGSTEKLNENHYAEAFPQNSLDWVAFKNQYFSAVLIAGNTPFSKAKLQSDTCSENSGFIKSYSAELETTLGNKNVKSSGFQFYFGPNRYRYLQSLEKYRLTDRSLDLEDLVYLGWPLFKWINRFFTIYIFDFLKGFGINMGIVLLLITLLMRFIVYPATRKSYVSTAKMRVLKPKIDEITKKYPNKADAMKRHQETMSLYSMYGVSPMGGCLPMLIQLPIWIAMFNFIPNAFELRQQRFLWADDLSTYDSIISFNHNYWIIGDHLSLFCLLFCATNLLYSWIMMKQQKDSMSGEQAQQMKMMQWMFFLMPLFFFYMFNKYSSGLNYYYFISLLAGAITMWYLRKTTDDKKILEKLEENYKQNKNNPGKKMFGFAARLQALQEQQKAELERRTKSNK